MRDGGRTGCCDAPPFPWCPVSSHTALTAGAIFNLGDTQVFGHVGWRKGYATWFPQPTQDAAQKLAGMGDKTLLGGRKGYEARLMKNPLAAATIIALAGDGAGREAIERTICHYNHARLHLSEFFLAECAYYALPAAK